MRQDAKKSSVDTKRQMNTNDQNKSQAKTAGPKKAPRQAKQTQEFKFDAVKIDENGMPYTECGCSRSEEETTACMPVSWQHPSRDPDGKVQSTNTNHLLHPDEP